MHPAPADLERGNTVEPPTTARRNTCSELMAQYLIIAILTTALGMKAADVAAKFIIHK